MNNITEYIKFEDCKEGYVYKIYARNFEYAIFYNDGFYGVRHKFNYIFIDKEIHWDKDERYGTVKPLTELNKIPDKILRALQYKEYKPHTDNTKIAHQVANNILIEYLNSLI